MPNILALLTCLTLQTNRTSLKQLGCIIEGMFPMLGISRWIRKEGSYRNIQRFCYSQKKYCHVFVVIV